MSIGSQKKYAFAVTLYCLFVSAPAIFFLVTQFTVVGYDSKISI